MMTDIEESQDTPEKRAQLGYIIDKLIKLDKKITFDQENIGRFKVDPYVYICDYQRTGMIIKTTNMCIIEVTYVEPIEGLLDGFYILSYSISEYTQLNRRILSMDEEAEVEYEIFENIDDLIKMLEKIYKKSVRNYKEIKNFMI